MEDSDIGLAVGLINRVLNRFQVRSGIRVITGDTSGKTSTVVNRKLDKLLTMGGGGTDMRPLIDEALSTSPKPQLVLVVTDGGTPWPESSKGVPVVACITRDEPGHEIPDWMGTFCMVK
jgi:predicted metal-dependent peptidase